MQVLGLILREAMGAVGNDRECFEPPTWAAEPVPGTSLTIISPHVSGETYPPNPVEPVTVPLDTKSFYVFGRNADLCDIHLAHGSASRIHAALVHHSNKRCGRLEKVSAHRAPDLAWLFRLIVACEAVEYVVRIKMIS